MTGFTLVRRSLGHYWRHHLGVGAGAATAAAVLIGALIVGDSVRLSLRQIAMQRLGATRLAAQTGDRLFRAQLADPIAAELDARVAPLLMLRGTARTPDGADRANQVQIVGVDQRFWQLGGTQLDPGDDEVVLNRRLADQLRVVAGDAIVLSFANPAMLSADVAIVNQDLGRTTLRLTVAEVVGADRFGAFGLEATHVTPHTAFVTLPRAQQALNAAGRANTLLISGAGVDDLTPEAAAAAVRNHFTLDDAQLELAALDDQPWYELRSARVFFDAPRRDPHPKALTTHVLTYLVNDIAHGDNVTPYSMVTATDARWLGDLADDQIAVNRWLADDLGAAVGDRLTLRYYQLAGAQRLAEAQATFTVARIAPMRMPFADATLMPAFPGVAEAASARDWDPGPAIDLSRISDKDDAYWQRYRGTPKAFITLDAGQKLWANRFGDVTAVRYTSRTASIDQTHAAVRSQLDPADFGLSFRDVRAEAIAASQEGPAAYFGSMFMAFSFFIIVAAVLLMALLFVFSIEQRASQVGLLLAVGFTAKQVRRLLLAEGAAVAAAGVIVGAAAAQGYTRAMLWGLSALWTDAVNAAALGYHATPTSLATGALGAFAVAVGAVWLTVRRRAERSAQALLVGAEPAASLRGGASGGAWWVAGVSGVAAMALVVAMAKARGAAQAGAFFGAGTLLLIAATGVASGWLSAMARRGGRVAATPAALGRTNAARRRGRSLAVIVLMACGTFLVVSVGANRKQPGADLANHAGPAGGFALYAEAAVPIHQNIDRTFAGAADPKLAEATVVPLRVSGGDDASCLNLNRARRPRLLGIRPEALAGRFRFVDSITADGSWTMLHDDASDDVLPAVADKATAVWGLGLGVGDTLDYTDSAGRSFKVRLVGLIEDSILQGALVVDEAALLARYPSISGYGVFLIDTDQPDELRGYLGGRYAGRGLQVTPTRDRLEAFLSVQNTYLSIFTVLGGLGLVVGSIGVGVVVLRNVMERRGELAVLRAVGYRRRTLVRMIAAEHGYLVGAGLAGGAGAAVVAVVPALTGAVPWHALATIGLMLGAVVVSAAVWIVGSAVLALRGGVMAALREQ